VLQAQVYTHESEKRRRDIAEITYQLLRERQKASVIH
jgi:hypothetical protein